MKEALFYSRLADGTVRCELCPHRCHLTPGKIGVCGVRQNIDGSLITHVYGRAIATHVDPIEKKPLFHVAPGSRSFSVATVGCNLHCKFCQNATISQIAISEQTGIPGEPLPPEQIPLLASEYLCRSIAYTYTEPTIYYEYARESAAIAHEAGIYNVFVSNGYISEEPLRQIAPMLDAANVDLKSFRDDFYLKLTGARLEPVLDTLRRMKELGIWLEVTTLIIPTWNDSDDELADIAYFIAHELGRETPWHISRFYPQYRLTDVPPTPVSTLSRARQLGQDAGLYYVYTGNVPGDKGESTYCYACGRPLIVRMGYRLVENHVVNGTCRYCNAEIHGIGLDETNTNG